MGGCWSSNDPSTFMHLNIGQIHNKCQICRDKGLSTCECSDVDDFKHGSSSDSDSVDWCYDCRNYHNLNLPCIFNKYPYSSHITIYEENQSHPQYHPYPQNHPYPDRHVIQKSKQNQIFTRIN